MNMKSADSPILLGRVSGLFGVRGWIKIHSHTSPRENILHYKTWTLEQHGKSTQHTPREGKKQGKGVIAWLEGFEDRSAAETLVGAEIYIQHDQLQPLELDEYYWSDLIGCELFNRQQESLGTVTELMETGANDVLVVRHQGKDHLIPFVDPWVIDVDLENQRIEVDWDLDY